MEFEWDNEKAARNLAKHGIDFEDAISIFTGPVLEVRSDREGEERWKAIGMLDDLEIADIFTLRAGRRRIISARRAGQNERRAYHQAHPGGPAPWKD